jgi:hypothetical protein
MLPIPTRTMVEKENLPKGSIPKVTVEKEKTIMKTPIFSTMKKTVKSIPKCPSMKLKF